MKKISLLIYCSLLILNLAVWIIVSTYPLFKMIVIESIIGFNLLLTYGSLKSNSKEAFKISLFFILPMFVLIEIIISIISSNTLNDNPFLILILGLIFFEFILTYSTIMISNRHNSPKTKEI